MIVALPGTNYTVTDGCCRQRAINRSSIEVRKIVMRTLTPVTGLAMFMTCCLSSAFAQSAPQDDVRAGRALALNQCYPCHIVSSDQEFPPIFTGPPKPPNFDAIANKAGTTAESLRQFLSTTHASVTMSLLTDDEMRKIISFILSLRDRR